MFEGASDYLAKKAQELGLERGDQLAKIQSLLDERYGSGQVRAVSLNAGALRLKTNNSSLASELRLGQVELKRKLGQVAPIKRLQIAAG